MLGSRAWRRYIAEQTKHLSKNWHDLLTLMIIKKLAFTTVEHETFDVIDQLKLNGCITSGLTAREQVISDQEAESIAKNNPDQDANFYLQSVLSELN